MAGGASVSRVEAGGPRLTRPPRLVIDGRRLAPDRTGVGRYLESLLAGWAATSLPLAETIVVLKDARGLALVPRAEGMRALVVGERWPGLVWERFGLGRVLRRGDVLFAPTNFVPAHWRGPSALVLFDAIQEVLPEGFPRLVRWRYGGRYRRAARVADRVLVPSESTARDVERIYGVPADRLKVIYPSPDPGFRPRPADDPLVVEARRSLGLGDDPFFLFVGKRSARRNVPAILAAFALHRARHPEHRLVFVGPHPASRWTDGILDAGHVPEPTLHGLMASAKAVMYPSEYEGFGLPIVEALASGCPVVTLRNSALVEAGGDGPWYLDAATPEAIALALEQLAVDREVRERHVARGLAHVTQFSTDRFAGSVRDELRALATSMPRPTRGAGRARARGVSGSR